MTRLIALIWCSMAGIGMAGDAWMPQTGGEFREALTDGTLQYDGASQDFRPSGPTLHTSRCDSWGDWRVEGKQYCNMWPPSDLWACYNMARSGEQLRFIGTGGDVTDAVYADK